jgi:hypothetical protein
MRTSRIYNNSVENPETASNIAIIGKLTIFVEGIAGGEVHFVLNPNIDHFYESKRTGRQSVSLAFTDDTVSYRLKPTSPPIKVRAVDECYEVSVAEIGTESLPGTGNTDYCVFDVRPLAPSAS